MDVVQPLFEWLNSLSSASLIIVKFAVATLLLFALISLKNLSFIKLKNIIGRFGLFSKGFYIGYWEIIPADSIQKSLENVLALISKLFTIIIVFFYLLYTLSFFEVTKSFYRKLISLVWNNVIEISLSILAYLPKLIFIILIIYITRWIITLFRSFMTQIETGRIKLHMFPAEYAVPTRQIITFAIIVFAMVIVAPYLPGSGSDAFKGVTVFLGILVSLGSTTAIANIIASFVIQYMQAFKVGDTVQIGQHTGTIVSINIFSTRMQNYANEYISIPNGVVLTSSLINYSKKNSAAVNVGVSIGYEVPWREVHAALLEAATKIDGTVTHPEPFVLQKSLDDFYVSYQLFVYIKDANKRPYIASELNEQIRDVFEDKNIEILSPHHRAVNGSLDTVSDIVSTQ